MCGIAGLQFKRAVEGAKLDAVAAFFAASLGHRGPDAFGVHRTDRGVFVNLRLAIVDRAGGDQPIYTPDRRHGIVYNGEVYNWQALREPLQAQGYPFSTHTDTESVLAAFAHGGTAALAGLNGMFALCIWDTQAGSLTLARDRFGSKPLYVYEDDACIAFASELRTLLGLPGVDDSLDPSGFQDYLTFRYALAPHTLFRRIQKLPAGCALTFDAAGRRLDRYAEICLQEPAQVRAPGEYVEELDRLLSASVRSQLMGEVPIGVLLSGGLDSSTIAYYVQRAGARLKAYSIGFAEINEFAFSRDVARAFDLDYAEICMTQDELLAGMDGVLLRLDEPIADPACFALNRLCQDMRRDVTVVLSGEGGDEMFAGYGQHLFALDPAAGRDASFARFFHSSANFDDANAWLVDKGLAQTQYRYRATAYDPADTALNGMLRFELSTWMPENLMMKADKILMSHSLEGRFPFLDLDVYGFAAQLPQSMKLPSPASSKHVLRTLMRDKLPRSVIERPKMGFSVPPAFFLARLRERFEDALQTLRQRPAAAVLDLDAVAALVRDFYANRPGIPVFKVWNLFVLVFWLAYVLPAARAGRPLRALLSDIEGDGVRLENLQTDAGARPAPALPVAAERRPRIAVYTVLIGDKEPLGNPLVQLDTAGRAGTDIDIDYLCFTDRADLHSTVWRFVPFKGGHLPPEKLSRRPKALPHLYLADYDYSLYIDNTVAFKRLPRRADLETRQPHLFRVFRHATRNNLREEADAVALLGYEEADTICRQLDFYAASRPLVSVSPLSTCTAMLRSHNHPKVQEFGMRWWESILAFSKRDQLSFDFARLDANCAVEYFDGTTESNDLLRWPVLGGGRRILANFDAARYAWVHRADPDARRRPHAHFLANAAASGTDYAKAFPLFEYICHKQGSSLGALVSPRRAVARALGEVLAPYRTRKGRLLVVRCTGADADALELSRPEADAAAQAIAMMLGGHTAQTFDVDAAGMLDTSVVFDRAHDKFDVVVILGLAPDALPSVAAKFAGLVAPGAGLLVVLAVGACGLAQIAMAQSQLEARLGGAVRSSVSPSSHDGHRGPIGNSLLCFEWPVALPSRRPAAPAQTDTDAATGARDLALATP